MFVISFLVFSTQGRHFIERVYNNGKNSHSRAREKLNSCWQYAWLLVCVGACAVWVDHSCFATINYKYPGQGEGALD